MQSILSLSKVTPKEGRELRREFPLGQVCDFIKANYCLSFSGILTHGPMRKNRTHYYMEFVFSGFYGRERLWICKDRKSGQWLAEIANGEFVPL